MNQFDVQLYFSGSVQDSTIRYLVANDVFRLCTFAYPKEAYEYLDTANEMGKRCRMIIDSGAFTAWSIGKPVQLPDLIRYQDDLLKRYGDKHDFLFISLDVIPGEKGRAATSGEIDKAVVQSYDNFCTMQEHQRGHYVLPVYHSGEDPSLRDKYLARTDYICLSMDQGMAEQSRLAWAKRAAVPGYKYHGLAATGNNMVTQVDWYSVDSSSWVTVAAMGSILWPTPAGRFRVLAVSDTSPSRHNRGEHILSITQEERIAVEAYIRSLGFDPDRLRLEHAHRWEWNIYQWLHTPWRRAVTKPMDLFS